MTNYSRNFDLILLNKFLTITAKYNVIESYYMEDTTPDGCVV